MADQRCPECGHEITDRGKYCPFCGCELRKGPKIPWAVLLVVMIAAACIVLAATGVWKGKDKGTDPTLRYGMSFREAAAEMEKRGFAADGQPLEQRGVITQNYKEHVIYGSRAYIISLEAPAEGKNGPVSLACYYPDSDEGYEKETSQFRDLKKYLSARHGDAVLNNRIYVYYTWKEKDGYFMLMDTGGMIVAGERHEK